MRCASVCTGNPWLSKYLRRLSTSSMLLAYNRNPAYPNLARTNWFVVASYVKFRSRKRLRIQPNLIGINATSSADVWGATGITGNAMADASLAIRTDTACTSWLREVGSMIGIPELTDAQDGCGANGSSATCCGSSGTTWSDSAVLTAPM